MSDLDPDNAYKLTRTGFYQNIILRFCMEDKIFYGKEDIIRTFIHIQYEIENIFRRTEIL